MRKEIKDIIIFDTTLRDGEQTPGVSMNIEEKIQIALQLEKLGVDIIEAGFATSNKNDFTAIQKISEQITNSTVCSLARAIDSDIKTAGMAIASSKNKRIHTFIATSKIHMEHKLKMTEDEVIKRAVNSILQAKEFTEDVEFSLEDATRTDIGFMIEIIDAVVEAGASTINLPDTVGIAMPSEIGKMVKDVNDYIGNRAVISVHNHNDLGLGVANSLEALKYGARQIECTINGIGERAGNAALEEIIMTMETRKDLYGEYKTNINKKEIYPTSKLVSNITGITPQANKAIVGKNAFLHESGIHQDGILKNKETYQIIDPKDIGYNLENTLVLGKHSGTAAFKDKVKSLGFNLEKEDLDKAFEEFKDLCMDKKEIYDEDISAIVLNDLKEQKEIVSLQSVYYINKDIYISILRDNLVKSQSVKGNGTMDSIFKTIDQIVEIKGRLISYNVESIAKGKDSLAKATVKVEIDGKKYSGTGLNLDTLSASGLAYVAATNKYLNEKEIK